MTNWNRLTSNVLLATGVLCAGLAIATWAGCFDPPGLTAHPQVLDLGAVATGDRVPGRFLLQNHTRKPIRLVGANEP